MIEAFVPFGSPAYFGLLGVVLLARGADFLSTWVATPRLVLEANPLARALGWRWGLLLNVGVGGCVALWPLPAVILATASLLVAARNFQSAWLARSMGEFAYRAWLGERLAATPRGLFLVCTLGQGGLTALLGLALIGSSPLESVPAAMGFGLLTYAFAAVLFPLLGARRVWRETRSPA
jgi:hypothetical protein